MLYFATVETNKKPTKTHNSLVLADGGSVWESNVIPDGISRTYEEHGGAKRRIRSTEERLMVPGCSPVFRKVFEISDRGKLAHTFAMHTSAEGQKFSGTDGKATVRI
jgi:hypothetical protein